MEQIEPSSEVNLYIITTTTKNIHYAVHFRIACLFEKREPEQVDRALTIVATCHIGGLPPEWLCILIMAARGIARGRGLWPPLPQTYNKSKLPREKKLPN